MIRLLVLFTFIICFAHGQVTHGVCTASASVTFDHFSQPASFSGSQSQCYCTDLLYPSICNPATMIQSSNLTASPVQNVTIYSKEGAFKFYLTFFDGTQGWGGENPYPSEFVGTYIFSPGEVLTSMTICGFTNSEATYGEPAGIRFNTLLLNGTTNSINLCAADTTETYEYEGITGTYFNGFYYGWQSGWFSVLGVSFSVPRKVVSAQFGNITYPTLGSIQQGLSPASIGSFTFCNDGKITATEKFFYSLTTGDNSCWEDTFGWNVGGKVGGEASFPEVFKVNAEISWGISGSTKTSGCNEKTITTSVETDINIPAFENGTVYATQWDSYLSDIPYTGTYIVTYDDGSSNVVAVSGVYSGSYLTAADLVIHGEPLPSGYVCTNGTITAISGNISLSSDSKGHTRDEL